MTKKLTPLSKAMGRLKKKPYNWFNITFYHRKEKKQVEYGIYVYGNKEDAIKEVKKIYPEGRNFK